MIISPSRWVTTTTAAQLCCSALLLKVSNTVSRSHFIWQDKTISIKGKVHEWYTIRLRYRHSFGISEIWTSSDRLVIRVWYFFSKIWISYFRSEIWTYITDLRYRFYITDLRFFFITQIWDNMSVIPQICVIADISWVWGLDFISQIWDKGFSITDPRYEC